MFHPLSSGLFYNDIADFICRCTAEKMRTELLKINMRDAIVIPYLNGVRLNDTEAKRWSNKYPDR